MNPWRLLLRWLLKRDRKLVIERRGSSFPKVDDERSSLTRFRNELKR